MMADFIKDGILQKIIDIYNSLFSADANVPAEIVMPALPASIFRIARKEQDPLAVLELYGEREAGVVDALLQFERKRARAVQPIVVHRSPAVLFRLIGCANGA